MKYLRLYQVTCGLYWNESLFPPFAQGSGDFLESKEAADSVYDGISEMSFDLSEIKNGRHAFNKTMISVDVPVDLLEDWMALDGAPSRQEVLNEVIWADGCVFHDPIKDDVFEIVKTKTGARIMGLRPYQSINKITIQ